MEQPTASSSSKVTVEYSDPSGIYPLISQPLSSRLPLRNLHWNSPSRPLRSINALHIDLVPDDRRILTSPTDPALPKARLSTPNPVLSPHNSSQVGLNTPGLDGRKERRHQIPGLRQTPYLKLYILRCEDTETYKAESRRLLREWIKEHTPPSQSSNTVNNQENHDAFEWLILHVVPIITDAASESRASSIPRSGKITDKASGSSRWPTRSSTSVLEKIRADFNGSSKSAVDRVAQIQFPVNPVVPGVSSPQGNSGEQQLHEDDSGWIDLISKMKSLVLASLDLRVTQYEEDIKEKESQRTLPGWNFCTFFVLKEGLARGFESVGLIDDALTSYHELAAGLDATIRNQNDDASTEQRGGLFRDYTEELLEQFEQARRLHEEDKPNVGSESNTTLPRDLGALILDTDRKPFRELILANNISAFDFQCYVFARQISLLLRVANVASPNKEIATNQSSSKETVPSNETQSKDPKFMTSSVGKGPSNLLILAEVCRRAIEFITLAPLTIREDLRRATQGISEPQGGNGTAHQNVRSVIVENLVASWTFSACYNILDKTSVESLSTQLYPLTYRAKSDNKFDHNAIPHGTPSETIPLVQRADLPTRNSSLQIDPTTLAKPMLQPQTPFGLPPDLGKPLPANQPQTGTQELAAERGDLYTLARRALSTAGLRHGWDNGWPHLTSETWSRVSKLDDVSLEDEQVKDTNQEHIDHETATAINLAGIRDDDLRYAMSSKHAFHDVYEDLTASALGLYVLGDKHKSAEGMTADMAVMRFHLGDYMAAASLFHQLAPFYAKDNWTRLEMSMLDTYAQCLKHLERFEEYARVLLKILAKMIQRGYPALSGIANTGQRRKPLNASMSNYEIADTAGYLQEALSISKGLKQMILVPMDKYFDDIVLDPYPRHYKDQDGFQLMLQLQYIMQDDLQAQQVRVRIVNAGEVQSNEIWLTAEGSELLKPGIVKILVGSNIMIPGWFVLDKITIQSDNIIFTHDLAPEVSSGALFTGSRESVASDSNGPNDQLGVLVWPRSTALKAKISLCKTIHLDRPKSIEINISSGWNSISGGKVVVRAGSAGLRLHTADAELVAGDTAILDKTQPGNIDFGELPVETNTKIKVPYRLDSDLKYIIVKAEISYRTANGSFTYACNTELSVVLPLDVNVQDIFKHTALFSKFTISTANSIPLQLLRCHLEGTADFESTSPSLGGDELDVFVRQPCSMISRISRKPRKNSASSNLALQTNLSLHVEYRCLDEEICAAVEVAFLDALKTTSFLELSQLLLPALLRTLRSRLSVQDLETIGLLREVETGTIEDYEWGPTLAGLQPDRQQELLQWLISWHQTHTTIPIPISHKSELSHYITIPVDVPQMQIVHTAQLRLLDTPTPSKTETYLATLGEVIPAELTIQHTRQWNIRNTTIPPPLSNSPLDFVFEIQASPDTWLIAGQRKTHFSAKESQPLTFPIFLLPQRTGYLLYPTLDIRPVDPNGAAEQMGERPPPSPAGAGLSCEVDWRGAGGVVLVVGGVERTSVAVGELGAGG